MQTQQTPRKGYDDVRRHIVSQLLSTASTRTLDDPLALDELEHALELATTWDGKTRPGFEREVFDAATLHAERIQRRAELRTARQIPSLSEAL